jgi:nickel-dependent lactate racemase
MDFFREIRIVIDNLQSLIFNFQILINAMILFSQGSAETEFTVEEIRDALFGCFDQLGDRKRVAAVPPDFTRYHSRSGLLTEMAWEYYGKRLADVLPATGTHIPMSREEIGIMFGRVPEGLFRVHDYRDGVTTLGEVPDTYVREVSGRIVDYGIPIQLNRLLAGGRHDLILSIGQVVPHEVIGMAGYNKNLFVGTGGAETINRTHFLGAAYGMERMMGRTDTPVRKILIYGSEHFARNLPIVYVLTVVGKNDGGKPVIRGLFIGDDTECFRRAAELSLKVNIQILDAPIRKAVVYLDPGEFKSTWLGNKSIYRTRMAMADGGELIILAPGLERFGEDKTIDRLIRKYGYAGTAAVNEAVRMQADLQESLTTAAHLIHGSSEDRFTITYCPGGLSRKEIESVHYLYEDLDSMMRRYNPDVLKEGFNTMADGEEIYFISNPAMGLWACRGRFE